MTFQPDHGAILDLDRKRENTAHTSLVRRMPSQRRALIKA